MKAVLLYILIIGLLFAGLLGILKIGEGIQAPDNVSGEWNIDEEFVHSVKAGCIPVLLPEENPSHKISITFWIKKIYTISFDEI